MARKWEIIEGKYAWNMEECEETLLIACYEEIKPYIPPNSWQADFENHFYTHGNGVAFSFLDYINSARRRRNLPTVDITETDVLDYARNPDKLAKSEFRKRTRAEYNAASLHIRQQIVDGAKARIATLVPPHQTYEEYKARSKKHVYDAELSRVEVARRVAATQRPEPAKPPSLELSKALVMLNHGSEDIIRRVIAKLSPDAALEALDHVADQSIKDMLILHSLGEAA